METGDSENKEASVPSLYSRRGIQMFSCSAGLNIVHGVILRSFLLEAWSACGSAGCARLASEIFGSRLRRSFFAAAALFHESRLNVS